MNIREQLAQLNAEAQGRLAAAISCLEHCDYDNAGYHLDRAKEHLAQCLLLSVKPPQIGFQAPNTAKIGGNQ
jgi:hypothetical protein